MKPSKELYDLIRAMSGSEKRYFKLNASMQKGNKNYLKLFDALDLQKTFDENAIREKFKNESFTRNLTVTKNYLYKLIFRSLIYYHNDKSVDSRLYNYVSRCKLLNEKGLFKQYFKTIEIGKELAYKSERFSSLLQFLEIEKYLMKKDEIGKKDMNSVYDEEISVLERIRDINDYKRIVSNFFKLTRTVGVFRDETSEKQINSVFMEKERERKPKSVRAKDSFYLAKILQNKLKGNYETAINYCKKRIELISNNPEIFSKSLVDSKMDSLELYLSTAIRLKQFKLVKSIFRRYKTLSESTGYDKLNYTLTEFEIKLSIAIEKEDKNAAVNLLPQIENLLIHNEGKILINTENYFHYNVSKYYFVTGYYNRALLTLNKFLSSKYLKSTPEFESYVRILNVIIHYELGNYKLLQYLIPSTKKYLMSKNKLYKFESTILRSIKSLIRTKEKHSETEIFKSLYKESLILKKERYEKNAFEYFDLTRWAEKKLI